MAMMILGVSSEVKIRNGCSLKPRTVRIAARPDAPICTLDLPSIGQFDHVHGWRIPPFPAGPAFQRRLK